MATVLLALLLIVLLIWLGTELVLAVLGLAPLLFSGEEIFSAFFSAPQLLSPALGIALGLLLALLGIFLLFLACAPGGLKRHSSRAGGRFAFLLDDKALAASLSAAIRKQTGLGRDQVVTRISPRQVVLTLTPTSGHRLDAQELTRLAQATLDSYALKPALEARVRIEKQGVLSHG
ncbi:hypothetical protein ACFP6B_01265 [Rothia nasimurium]|uniref:hypothetical protein n=1 Tax=Rothia nasimurium TaxID=85336 RepID=UPI003621C148